MPNSFIHSWVVRAVGRTKGCGNDIFNQLSVENPQYDVDTLRDWVEKHEHFDVDDEGNIGLTDAGLEELQRLETEEKK